jgi:uncharacterized membrane protein YeaQ/YmgE (transglycosylase-associated protein family)
MNTTYIWCVIGLIAGVIMAFLGTGKGQVQRIETVTMGVFGAVIGGDMVPSLFGLAAPDGAFRASALAFSVGGAITMLTLLGLMRRSVGPLRPSKEKSQR